VTPGLAPDGTLVTTNLYRLVIPVRPGEQNTMDNSRTGVTLEKLVRRQNRFLHVPVNKVHELNVAALLDYISNPTGLDATQAARFRAQHLVLRNVLSFDVRAYHPGATERHVGQNIPMAPGDVEWDYETGQVDTGSSFQDLRSGAYIDLGCNESGITAIPNFQEDPDPRSQLTLITWDTWPFYYERDEVDQDDNGGLIDEGVNGLNDNPNVNGVVDDPLERETAPPYPFPLRGVQVRVRIVDPDSQQVRQVTMAADFVPE
jgi:hypothetical protein